MFARHLATRNIVPINVCTKIRKALYSNSDILHVKQGVQEIEIPVPWGKVAGKLWGSQNKQNKQPILALHGWQDNAASFDNIAPLIVKNSPILAIDLPGHGLSSWIPPGFMYTELVYFLLIKRLKRYFEWEKVKIMGHSLGGMTTYWYAATFPTEIQYVVSLDSLPFLFPDASVHAARFKNAVEYVYKLEEDGKIQPTYSENEIIKKGVTGEFQLSEAAYKILMSRGTKQQENGMYVFTRDPRLRIMPIHGLFAQEHMKKYAELIKCPYLIIKSEYIFEGDKTHSQFYEVLEVFKKNNNKVHFKTISVPSHHFHLTHAETTAAMINEFLEKYDKDI